MREVRLEVGSHGVALDELRFHPHHMVEEWSKHFSNVIEHLRAVEQHGLAHPVRIVARDDGYRLQAHSCSPRESEPRASKSIPASRGFESHACYSGPCRPDRSRAGRRGGRSARAGWPPRRHARTRGPCDGCRSPGPWRESALGSCRTPPSRADRARSRRCSARTGLSRNARTCVVQARQRV